MANCGRCLRCLPDELNGNGQYLLLRPQEQLQSTAMSTSVCLSVFPLREYLRNHTRDLYHFCACCLWPWLGPSPASLRAAIRYVLPVLWITSFFREMSTTLRSLYAIAIPSVVCLSVTLVHPTQPVEIFGNFFSLYDSPGTQYFSDAKIRWWGRPFSPEICVQSYPPHFKQRNVDQYRLIVPQP